MSGTYSSLVRNPDRQIANEANDRTAMCRANGCPSQWSNDFGEKLCSAHAYAPPHEWPRITEMMLHEETERARRNGQDRPKPKPLTRDEIRAALHSLKGIGGGLDAMGVLEGLRKRREHGPLGRAQREFLEHLEDRLTPRKDDE